MKRFSRLLGSTALLAVGLAAQASAQDTTVRDDGSTTTTDMTLDYTDLSDLVDGDNMGDHTATEAIDMSTFAVNNMADPVLDQDAVTLSYLRDYTSALTADNLGNHVATQYLEMSGFPIINVGTPTGDGHAANKKYVDDLISGVQPDNLGNHIATQKLQMDGNTISGLRAPVEGSEAVNLDTLNSAIEDAKDNLGNHIATQDIDAAGNSILNVLDPVNALDAANKQYVDGVVGGLDFVAPDRAINTVDGILGGGDLSSDLTLSFDTAFGDARYVEDTVAVRAGNGLAGGGTLEDDVVLSFDTAFGDARYVNMTGDESVGGNKTFTGSVSVGVPTSGDHATNKDYVDALVAANLREYTAGDGLTLNGTVFAVDATVVRTEGNQSIAGVKTFTDATVASNLFANHLHSYDGASITIAAGETNGVLTDQVANLLTEEGVWIGAEDGLRAISSPDNWASGWSGRHQVTLIDQNGDTILNNLAMGGDIDVNGHAIRDLAWPIVAGDAANKAYVDAQIADAGITGGDGVSVSNATVSVDSTVVRTAGDQTIAGAKTFSGAVNVQLTPTSNLHATNKAYVDAQIAANAGATYLAGDGMSLTGDTFAVDHSVVRTAGEQSISGIKTFADSVRMLNAPVNGTDLANKTYVDNSIVLYDAGPGLSLSGSTFSIDGTVVRTTGNQSIDGVKTFVGIARMSAAPVGNTDLANKAYVDAAIAGATGGSSGGGTTYDAGAGLTLTGSTFAVDASVIRTTGDQSMGGTKTFTGTARVNRLPTANTDIANKQYVDANTVAYTAGAGIALSGTEISVDSTVVRTQGDQVVAGAKNFSDDTLVKQIRSRDGKGLHLTAGETNGQVNKSWEDAEFVYLGAEGGVKVISSADNWSTTAKTITTINDTEGNSNFANNVYANSMIAKATGSAGTPAIRFTADPNTGMYLHGGDQLGLAAGGNRKVWIGTGSVYFDVIPRTAKAPSGGDHLTNKTYVDGLVRTAGDGLTLSGRTLAVNTSVVRTGSQTQSIAGTKTFTGTARVNRLPTANADIANKQYVDSKAGKTYTAGDGISLSGTTFAVNGTVVRTSGNQTVNGQKTFTGLTTADTLRSDRLLGTGDGLRLLAGEAHQHLTDSNVGTAEAVWLGGESGVVAISSPDNWSSGWGGRHQITLLGSNGVTYLKALSMSGNVDMNGKKITELAWPSATTDAVRKDYVDGRFRSAGDGLTLSGTTLAVNTSVVRTGSQTQSIAGTKTFTGTARVNRLPTANADLANKQYVDSKVKTYAGGAGISVSGTTIAVNSSVVRTGSQTQSIAGTKTFTGTARVNRLPTANADIANKQYVDSMAGKTYSASTGIWINTSDQIGVARRRGGDSSTGVLWYNGTSRSNGYFFTGSSAPSRNGNDLKYQGNFWANYMYSKGYFYHSDRALKKDIEQISGDEGMAIVNAIEPVKYHWKDDGVLAHGVIAQQIEGVMPTIVETDEAGMKSVDYIQMISPLLAAIQQLDDRVEALEAQLGAK